MGGYAKVFTRILDSTVWRENDQTRLLWITMLALADREGVVHCTVPGLADRAKISLEACEYGLGKFMQPDKYSWSKESEGRRIREVDSGWLLINHEKFRNLMSYEETKEKTRLRVAKHRSKQKALHSVTNVTSNASNDIASASTKATTTTKTESQKHCARPTIEQVQEYCQERGNSVDPQTWLDHYTSNGFKIGKNSMKDWRAAVRTWERNGIQGGKQNGNKRDEEFEAAYQRVEEADREGQKRLPIVPSRSGR